MELPYCRADVAELADALDSGSSSRKGVEVQVLSSAPKTSNDLPATGTITNMVSVQIFGVKNSPGTRAAERFFKERSIAIHLVDLKQKPMSPGELRRFVERFTLPGLRD